MIQLKGIQSLSHPKMAQYRGKWLCPLVIITKVKLFFRPDKTRKKELMVQPVFCIVDAGSCLSRFITSIGFLGGPRP